jgi:hypothetical protein
MPEHIRVDNRNELVSKAGILILAISYNWVKIKENLFPCYRIRTSRFFK